MELGNLIEHLTKIQKKYGSDLDVILHNKGDEFSEVEYEAMYSRPTVGIFEDDEFDEIGSIPDAFRNELNINSVLIS